MLPAQYTQQPVTVPDCHLVLYVTLPWKQQIWIGTEPMTNPHSEFRTVVNQHSPDRFP